MIDSSEKDIKTASIVAQWWAGQIGKTDCDLGNTLNSAIGQSFREKVADRNAPKAEAFKIALTEILLREKLAIVSVDYNPDYSLAEALEIAGIPAYGALPSKTVTTTYWETGVVKARLGYDGEMIELSNGH